MRSAHGRLARRYPAVECSSCGGRTDLTRHHLIPRSQSREPGIRHVEPAIMILCRPCHKTLHDAYTEWECATMFPTPESVRLAIAMLRLGAKEGA